MITRAEKTALASDFNSLRELWIFRARVESNRIQDGLKAMEERGFEQISATPDAIVTEDGREILRAYGKAWALHIDIHNARLALSFKEAKQEQPLPGEALTSVLCPVCRSVMAKQPICPNCAQGKAGFKILCQCTECGHEVYL